MTDNKILYILQGVPGSGKSTIARMIRQWYSAGHASGVGFDVPIVSTDDYRLDENGAYVFNAKDNARYHQMAQQRAAELMAAGTPVVIIDNTNIQEWQAHPYMVLAEIWSYTIQVVSVDCGLDLAIKRQSEREGLGDRAVPPGVIADMYWKMERLMAKKEDE